MRQLYLLMTFFLLGMGNVIGQCEEGEVTLDMILYTDAWGYEVYWEIVPAGNACGDGTIASGGNFDQVGCDGGGGFDAGGGNGYDNNAVIEVEDICLMDDTSYDLIFVDDYADGGLTFVMFENTFQTGVYVGEGAGTVWTFTTGDDEFPVNDSPCDAAMVEVDNGSVVINNELSSVQLGEAAPPGGFCALPGYWCEGGLSSTAWASFIAPSDGFYQISTCNPETTFDSQIAVYEASDCGDLTTFELVASNDDIPGGCGNGAFYSSACQVSCLTEGETYYIQVDGWYGSAGNAEVTVSSWEGEAYQDAVVFNINCPLEKGEEANATIIPFVVGWNTQANYSWAGPDGFESDNQVIDGLQPGEYTVTATDVCTEAEFTNSYTIFNPDPYFVTVSSTGASCPESFDGSIELEASGATPPYSYEWYGPDEYFSVLQDPQDLDDGTYILNLYDGNGCLYEQEVVVDMLNDVELDLGADTTLCLGDDMVLFGPPGFNYEWQDGSINQFFEVEADEYGEGSFGFILTVSNDEGCEALDAVTLTITACTHVDEFEESNVVVFPNPTDGDFRIDGVNGNGQVLIEIRDLAGKIVHSEGLVSVTGQGLQISPNLASGLYMVNLTQDGTVLSSPLIVE